MKIEIIISPSGESRVEAHGYSGNSCRVATKAFENALGSKSSETLKPEFYQTESNPTQQKETT